MSRESLKRRGDRRDSVNLHVDNHDNPHEVSAVQVGAYTKEEVDALVAPLSTVGHNHDDRYYTESEIDALLADKAALSHTHDDRYYTESEINALLGGKSDTGHTHTESDITDLGNYSVVGHTHDGRYYTETEIDTFLSAKANVSHTHPPSELEQEGATDGQFIAWNDTAGQWEPVSGGGGLSASADETITGEWNFERGISGSYNNTTGNGADWGANIWAIGHAYSSSGAGTSFAEGNHYGLVWYRDGHTSHRNDIEEGLYVYQNGAIKGGIGSAGIYTIGDIKLDKRLYINANGHHLVFNTDAGSERTLIVVDKASHGSEGTRVGNISWDDTNQVFKVKEGAGIEVHNNSGRWYEAHVTDNSTSGIFRVRDSNNNSVGQMTARSFNGSGGGYVELEGDWRIGTSKIPEILTKQITWNPGNLSSGQVVTTNTTISGASVGDVVSVGQVWYTQSFSLELFGYVVSANTVVLALWNNGSSSRDPSSRTFTIAVIKNT